MNQRYTPHRGDPGDTAGPTPPPSPPCGARVARACVTPACPMLSLATSARRHPLHNLGDEALGHFVHGHQRCRSPLGDAVAALCQPRHHGTSLHEQRAHRGEQARQPLPLCLCALSKQRVFFDRPAARVGPGRGRGLLPTSHAFGAAQGRGHSAGPQPRKIPGSLGYPMGSSCAVVSDLRIRTSAKPKSLATWRSSAVDLVHPCLGPGRHRLAPCWNGPASVAWGSPCRPRHTRATTFSARDASIARAWRCFTPHEDHQGDIQRHVPRVSEGDPVVFWPAAAPPSESCPRRALPMAGRAGVGGADTCDAQRSTPLRHFRLPLGRAQAYNGCVLS